MINPVRHKAYLNSSSGAMSSFLPLRVHREFPIPVLKNLLAQTNNYDIYQSSFVPISQEGLPTIVPQGLSVGAARQNPSEACRQIYATKPDLPNPLTFNLAALARNSYDNSLVSVTTGYTINCSSSNQGTIASLTERMPNHLSIIGQPAQISGLTNVVYHPGF
ncbi:MAG: hypothetical protein SFU25_08945 [Candidatus Caenarcaniphilales bacterium]|nr:hypothetical protein [Candidatus Caenarcaniphilales bacterium]